jgi:hypothetical protein
MSEIKKKRRKKRILAMTYKEKIFMAKLMHRLAKNESVGTLAEASRQLGKDLAFVRHAVLEKNKGAVSKQIRIDVLQMAGIKPAQSKKQKTGEPA